MDSKSVKRPRLRILLRRLLIGLALPPFIFLVFLVVEHLRGHYALARYILDRVIVAFPEVGGLHHRYERKAA